MYIALIFFVSSGGVDSNRTKALRVLAADQILVDPSLINYLVDQTPAEYSKWVRQTDMWGGDIELSIFSKHFAMEIVTINVKTGQLHRWGDEVAYSP